MQLRLHHRFLWPLVACAAAAGLAIALVSTAGAKLTTTTFTWWTSSDKPTEIATIDKAFHKAYPRYMARGQYIAQSDEYLPKVIAAIKDGSQPTVLFDQSPSDLPELATSGKLIPLNGKVNADTKELYPGLRAATFYRGKQLGLALASVGDIALFYNKADFAVAGIKKPPATWTQLAADAAKLTATSGGKYAGFYVPTGDAEWISYDFEPVLWGDGGSLLNANQTKATFNSAAGVKALTTWVKLVKSGAAPNQSYAADGNFDGPTAFSSGAVAMITDGVWLEGETPSTIKYGVAPYPAGSKGKSTNIGIGVVALLKTSSSQDAGGLDFINFLGSPREGAYLASESGGLPSAAIQTKFPSVKAELKKTPYYSVFANDLKYGKVRPITPAYNTVSQDLWTAVNAAIAGKESPKAALDKAAAQADRALKSIG